MSELIVVAGEMERFSDRAAGNSGSPLWRDVLGGISGSGGQALVVGSVDLATVRVLAERFGEVTCVVRSVPDAQELRSEIAGQSVTVVAGSLEAWAKSNTRHFDAVIVIDGLDRVQGCDVEYLPWLSRLGLVAGALRDGGCLLLTLTNQFSLGNILDARPAHERHGNDEWVPQHSGVTRPTAVPELLAALAEADLPVSQLFAGYGDYRRPGALVEVSRLRKMRADDSLAAAVGRAIAAGGQYWLADPREAWASGVRAGEADTIADFWLVTSGTVSLGPVYLASGGMLTVPDGPTVASKILAWAECGEVPKIRELAAQVGEWARTGVTVRRLDRLVISESGFVPGFCSLPPGEVSNGVALAALWFGLRNELLATDARHPWPPWQLRSGLVESWLAAGGWELSSAELAQAAELAQVWAEPPVRSVRADLAQIRVAENRAAWAEGRRQAAEELLELKQKELEEETTRLQRRIDRLRSPRRVLDFGRRLLGGKK